MLPSRAPLLIVPIRDRRQHRRILTIRNCAISVLVLAVIFAGISIYNDSRRIPVGEYGRLIGTPVTVPNGAVPRKVDVINEGPVPDQSASDPLLVTPAAREQVTANTTVPVTPVTTAPAPPARPAVVAQGHGTTIVGDGKGVTVVKAPSTSTAPQPVLSGGIFKGQ